LKVIKKLRLRNAFAGIVASVIVVGLLGHFIDTLLLRPRENRYGSDLKVLSTELDALAVSTNQFGTWDEKRPLKRVVSNTFSANRADMSSVDIISNGLRENGWLGIQNSDRSAIAMLCKDRFLVAIYPVQPTYRVRVSMFVKEFESDKCQG
jgi:hypothetical protein